MLNFISIFVTMKLNFVNNEYIKKLKFLFVNKRTHKHTRAFVTLRKRTGSAKIVIGGMDDENDTKKRNAYN